MATAYSPKIPLESLRVAVDFGNTKSYVGSGNSVSNIAVNEIVTNSSIVTVADAVAGTAFEFTGSSPIDIPLSPALNHETWSTAFWVKSTGVTPSNYRQIIRLTQSAGPGYFYIFDTRETTNCRILGYQRDYYLNSWFTTQFTSSVEWLAGDWWFFGVSHDNTFFKSYKQGELIHTGTQTRDVADYEDIPSLNININYGNAVRLGSVYLYERVLSDAEFKQLFDATRSRFGV